MKFYTGIGSRQTPGEVCTRMTRIARDLRSLGYSLRSGGALAADSAFARGAGSEAVIYLPWKDFPVIHTNAKLVVCGDDPAFRAIAEELHPNWRACGQGARKLHTRNVPQIVGHEEGGLLSEFVVCWTPNGGGGGGTGGALRVAKKFGVKDIYDLALPSAYEALLQRIERT